MISSMGMNTDRGRARVFLQGVNCRLIERAARRRLGVGQGDGARSPIAAARGPVELVELTRRCPGGKVEQITPNGWKTARRRLPPVLAALEADHPRMIAATGFAVICERIGAIKGADLAGGGGGNSSFGVSDGGATTKARHAEALWQIRGALNQWPITRPSGRYVRSLDRVVMAPGNKRGNRQPIKAFDLVARVCIEGQDLKEILTAHGWSAHNIHRKKLRAEILELLDIMATETGWTDRE